MAKTHITLLYKVILLFLIFLIELCYQKKTNFDNHKTKISLLDI